MGSTGLYSAQSHDAHERLVTEPGLRCLRTEMSLYVACLGLISFSAQRDIEIRLAKVTVVLDDLVAENRLLPAEFAEQLRKESMILMCVMAPRSEYQVGV